MRTNSLALLVIAILSAACADRALEAPTGPTLLAGLSPATGRAVALTSGPRAIGPELAPQSCALEGTLRSVSVAPTTQIEFINQSSTTRFIYWLSGTGARVHYGTVPSRYTWLQPTYVTHPWVVTDESGACLGIYSTSQDSTVTLRDTTAPLSAALIATSLAAEINTSFIAAMHISITTALVGFADGSATCTGGGTLRLQHAGPAPGSGHVTLSNTPIAVSGCTHTLNGRTVVAHGVLRATGTWSASQPSSPVRLTGDLGIDDLGTITIDGTTGVSFLGQVGGVGVGAPDTSPSPQPGPGPGPATGKYDGTYDFSITFPVQGGQSTIPVQRFFIVTNGTISSSDNTLAGVVTNNNFGNVQFTGPCPHGDGRPNPNQAATFTGILNALSGPKFGEGTFVCRSTEAGIRGTWRAYNGR